MTDAHCHVSSGDPALHEFLIGRDFVGVHPWESLEVEDGGEWLPKIRASLTAQLLQNDDLGVGEIGLDRLRARTISSLMRDLFTMQLELALQLKRPVVLHGAKCWGQVVKTIEETLKVRKCVNPTSFLFHGFSRSDGLIPAIVALNGYISVGSAVLNDHAVNYRALVSKIPSDRLLVETDRTQENEKDCPTVSAILSKVADLRGLTRNELEALTDANAIRFKEGRL